MRVENGGEAMRCVYHGRTHNCVVVELNEWLRELELVSFAANNGAVCRDPDDAPDDTFFVRLGNGPQGGVSQGGLLGMIMGWNEEHLGL